MINVVDPTVDTAIKAGRLANAMCHIKNNRIEYLVLSLLLYSTGLVEKATTYGANVCV